VMTCDFVVTSRSVSPRHRPPHDARRGVSGRRGRDRRSWGSGSLPGPPPRSLAGQHRPDQATFPSIERRALGINRARPASARTGSILLLTVPLGRR
jgi:hypothetical protein